MTDGIAMDTAVCHGKPVISGTRVLVSTILGALADGDSVAKVAEDYGLTASQISAGLGTNPIQMQERTTDGGGKDRVADHF
jgi:uncharacterized protein (DUF433 family)